MLHSIHNAASYKDGRNLFDMTSSLAPQHREQSKPWQGRAGWAGTSLPSLPKMYKIAGHALHWTSLVLSTTTGWKITLNKFNTSVISHRTYDPVCPASAAPLTLCSSIWGLGNLPNFKKWTSLHRILYFIYKNLTLSSTQSMQNPTPSVSTQGTAGFSLDNTNPYCFALSH